MLGGWLYVIHKSVGIFARFREQTQVKETVEEFLCRKLATDYANDPSSSTVQTIAQLQICLAQTLKGTAGPERPRNLDIQSPRPSTSTIDTTRPTPSTPPTPPSSIKIQ